MPSDDHRWLEAAAHAIAEGDDPDWRRIEADAGPDGRRTVADLQLIAKVAEVHRTPTAANWPPSVANSCAVPSSNTGTWGPLVLLERVGGGAYGDVYRAHDPRVDREVALKLLRHDPGRETADDLVVHEARLLARVRHPHVVTVYGADRYDGRVGLWMEFIRGRSLESELTERGLYSAEAATRVGIDLCGALGAVHKAGLVHRDIKAGNVMREEGGWLVLMDFGTGCDQPGPDAPPVPTVVGTPVYVAPEMLDRQPATASSDVYALGVLLYHLATGEYPVTGMTLDDVREAHHRGERRRLRDTRADLPSEFVSIVDRALAANPADRFETAEEMEAALRAALKEALGKTEAGGTQDGESVRGWLPRFVVTRSLWLTVAALLIIIAGAALAYVRRADAGAAGRELGFGEDDSVLISAFENRTKDARFDGLVEYAIGRALARSPVFRVASQERIGDALQLMGRMRTTRVNEEVGREVCLRDGAIRALVSGSLEGTGGAIRVTARLIQPASDRTIWSASLEAADGQRLLAAASDLGNRIRAALGEHRTDIEQTPEMLEKATTNLKALQLYSQGLALLDLDSGEHWMIPRAFFDAAIKEDPNFAIAYAYRSWTHGNLSAEDAAQRLADSERAFQLAERANQRERFFIRGTYFGQRMQHDKAAAEYSALVKLSPNDYWAVNNLAFEYERMRATDKALPWFIRRAELRPNGFDVNGTAFTRLLQAGRSAEAARYAARVRALAARSPAGESARDALANVELLPVFTAWHERNLSKAVGELQRLKTRVEGHPARWELVDLMLQWYAALGRLHDADTFALEQEAARLAARPTPSPDLERAELTQAWNAYFRGDRAGARLHLLHLYSQFPPVQQNWRAMILMARVGMTRQAKTILSAAFSVNRSADTDVPSEMLPFFAAGWMPYYQGELALGEGRFAEAVKILAPLRMGPPVLRQQALAMACEAHGDLQGALAAIERFSPMSVHMPIWLPVFSGPWYEMRASQARILLKLGRRAEAEGIDAELRTLLAVADRDYAVRAQLK